MVRKNKKKTERVKPAPNKTERKRQTKKGKKPKNPHLVKIFTLGIFIFLALGASVLIYPSIYRNKIFPGVKVGRVNLSGKTFIEALNSIEASLSLFNEKGLVFIFKDEEISLQPTLIGTDIDSSIEILSFDSNQTINNAYQVGRGKNYWTNFKEQLAALFFNQPISLEHYFNRKDILQSLQENLSKYETPHEDASLVINKNFAFTVKKEKIGSIFDYQTIVTKAEANVKNLITDPVYAELVPDLPEITLGQAEKILPQVRKIVTYAPLTLRYGEKSWEIDQETFSRWLEFKIKTATISNLNLDSALKKSSAENQKIVVIGLDPQKVDKYLESIRKEIELDVKEGKFKIEEGKVVQFQASQPGTILAAIPSIQKMEEDFIEKEKKETELVVLEKQPEINTENINDLGIKELVGVGRSNFSGSPRNRRANIKLGADKLNGLLIKPDEIFSLLKALGKFAASEGWLPELVIKGNRTIPELGGGACQFGTTMFRAALNSGLPILERRNHSYTVTYYYPIGTDATIYDPAPDLKYLNDTGHYLLIQAKVEGNDLIFELWGMKDGRVIEQTEPKYYNWQSPPPMKIIETEDIAPGEEKCTERAHKGVSAEFTYKVAYLNGEVKEEVFKSKYKPWQEVCLRGVEKKIESATTN